MSRVERKRKRKRQSREARQAKRKLCWKYKKGNHHKGKKAKNQKQKKMSCCLVPNGKFRKLSVLCDLSVTGKLLPHRWVKVMKDFEADNQEVAHAFPPSNVTWEQAWVSTTGNPLTPAQASDPYMVAAISLTGPNRGTFTVPQNGIYSFKANIVWEDGDDGARSVGLYKNGSETLHYTVNASTGAGAPQSSTDAAVLYLLKGDTIQVRVMQFTGSALDILADDGASGIKSYWEITQLR